MQEIKGAIMLEIYELMEQYPEYTFGQILQTFTRKSVLGTSLYEASDRQIYTAIEKAKTIELEQL